MVLPWHLEPTGRDGWRLVLADGPDSQCLRRCVLLVADPVANGPARRWWFACPDCQRRCGRIWLITNPWMFVCRACGSVTYASRQRIHPRRQEAQLLRFLAPWVPAD